MALALVCTSALAILFVAGAGSNPAGFFVDEASIAYNAQTVARGGVDEYGNPWPLFFRAFGEYKSPAYIYLLAAVFKLTGPSIAVARGLSATLGLAACALLGLLSARATRRRAVGLAVFNSARRWVRTGDADAETARAKLRWMRDRIAVSEAYGRADGLLERALTDVEEEAGLPRTPA